MLVYTAKVDGCGCSFKTLDEAVEFIAIELENTFSNSPAEGDVSLRYYIDVEEMTEEEFDNLGEFDGF